MVSVPSCLSLKLKNEDEVEVDSSADPTCCCSIGKHYHYHSLDSTPHIRLRSWGEIIQAPRGSNHIIINIDESTTSDTNMIFFSPFNADKQIVMLATKT